MAKKHRKTAAKGAILLLAALAALPSCVYEHYDASSSPDGSVAVELTVRTRSVTSDTHIYEEGSAWENYIDIAGGDYRIYFFTNDRDDASATDDSGRNTLIAEFVPTELTSVNGAYYTRYTISGKAGDDIAAHSDFKVVVLANWGRYPTVTAGETTIDALVEGDNTTFSAETFFNGVDADHLIPFFGVREYSGVEWKEGWRTTLIGDISLLRAIAKVEVVMSEDSEIDGFDDVSIVRYNSEGYCAPKGVYLRADYDHDYIWEQDFTDNVHLVGGRNSTGGGSAPLSRQPVSGPDVWTIHLPEYDNTSLGSDPSFIKVTVDGTDHEIHFANYTDGETSSNADYDILRNCLYRFYVTVLVVEREITITVRTHVDKWEACFDNEYTFDAE